MVERGFRSFWSRWAGFTSYSMLSIWITDVIRLRRLDVEASCADNRDRQRADGLRFGLGDGPRVRTALSLSREHQPP